MVEERLDEMYKVLKYTYLRYNKRQPNDDKLTAQATLYSKDLFEIPTEKLGEAFSMTYHQLDSEFVPLAKAVLAVWKAQGSRLPEYNLSRCQVCIDGLAPCYGIEKSKSGKLVVHSMRAACFCSEGQYHANRDRPMIVYQSQEFKDKGLMTEDEALAWRAEQNRIKREGLVVHEEAIVGEIVEDGMVEFI